MLKRLLMMTLLLVLMVSAAAAEWYYNPDGGTRFHADANCPSVSTRYRPMQEITYGPALAQGLKPCTVCVCAYGYMLQGDDYVHINPECVQLAGASRPVRMVMQEEAKAWSLKTCIYCMVDQLSNEFDALRPAERWYDPQGGIHFHHGGVDCPAVAEGAYDRRETAALVDGQYCAAEDGRLLMPCGVCLPYGESSKAVLYREMDGGQSLHTSAYCPKILPAYRATNRLVVVAFDDEAAREAQLCPMCMGDDQTAVYAWYNTAGGSRLHRVRDCRTMSDEYYAYECGLLEDEAEAMLQSGYSYCDACWNQ